MRAVVDGVDVESLTGLSVLAGRIEEDIGEEAVINRRWWRGMSRVASAVG